MLLVSTASRLLTAEKSRRTALAGLLSGLIVTTTTASNHADAKKNRKKRRKKKKAKSNAVSSASAETTLSGNVQSTSFGPVYLSAGSALQSECSTYEEEASDRFFLLGRTQTPPTACEGGVVWATKRTLFEADQISTAGAASDATFSSRIVPLSGDESQNKTNVLDAMAELHQEHVAQTVSEADREMPEPGVARQTDNCKRGKVPRYKRKHLEFRSNFAGAKIHARVSYKRWSCEQWEIYETRARLGTAANRPVRTLEARYFRTWWGGDSYAYGTRALDCATLSTNSWAIDDSSLEDLAGWNITTNGDFQYAVIADSDQYPPSCFFNTGVEAKSAWVILKGPNR
jgi:hypothetical protein